jgi:hypothetical protein
MDYRLGNFQKNAQSATPYFTQKSIKNDESNISVLVV